LDRKRQIFLKYYFLQRIKSNQIQKLLREEKEVLAEQVATLQTQVEAQMLVVRNLEEKEQVLQKYPYRQGVKPHMNSKYLQGAVIRNRIVVGFTTTYAISSYHH
jgi:tetrahydromethanopterin S-methyltransferase subunit B